MSGYRTPPPPDLPYPYRTLTGRTGTLIAAEYIMQKIMLNQEVDMVEMVKVLRSEYKRNDKFHSTYWI